MRHSSASKEIVLGYVKAGWSYGQIQKEYNVPKSTISTWVKNEGIIPDRTKQLEHLAEARIKAIEAIHRNKAGRMALAESNAKLELRNISFENISFQKTLLAMLYWAEGAKSPKSGAFMFVNTDPLLLKLYITTLRNAFSITESRFRIGLQLHSYHDPEQAINYWSELLQIPKSQFWKIYVKKRSEHKKFRENFQGMCSIYYGSKAIREELLFLGKLLAQNIQLLSFNG